MTLDASDYSRRIDRIKAGEVSAEDAGRDHKQGGGGGWWQPVAMLYAGDPEKASAVGQHRSCTRDWRVTNDSD